MNEAEYWEDIFDEASKKGDDEMMELATRHLELVYPNVEDTALLGSTGDEVETIEGS